MIKRLIWENKIQFADMVNEAIALRSSLIKDLHGYEKKIINYSSEYESEKANKIKGDMFEVLSAVFFERMGDSPYVGLNNYKIVALEDDYGVDATGESVAGVLSAVQVKFRSNPRNLIAYSDLAKTFTYSVVRGWSNFDSLNSIWLFTNSDGVTPACTTVFGNRLKVINRQTIRHHLDNNIKFWENFIKKIYDILGE